MDTENSTTEPAAKPTGKLSLKSLQAETDERMSAIEDNIVDLSEAVTASAQSAEQKFDAMMEAIQSINAKHNPREITPDGLSSQDTDANETNDVYQFKQPSHDNEEANFLERSTHDSVHSAEFKQKAEQLKFDMEMIEVLVQSSNSQNPDNTFTLGVNGRLILVVRGAKQWIPRCYVEVMARSKVSSYGNVEFRNDQNELEVKHPETKSSRYPFNVLTDRNPLGQQWLERVTNDAA